MRLYLLNTTMERLQEHPCGIPQETQTTFHPRSSFPSFTYGKLNGEAVAIQECDFWYEHRMYHPLAIIYDAYIENRNQFPNPIPTSFSERSGNPIAVNIFYMHEYCFVVQSEMNVPARYWKAAPCVHQYEPVLHNSNQQRCTKCGYINQLVDVSHEW